MRSSCLVMLGLFLVQVPLSALGQGTKATSRGDRQIDRYFRQQTEQIARECLADIKTRAEWEKRRLELRRQFLEMVGLWPIPPKTDLKATIVGRINTPKFTIEKVHFQSSPGLYVSGNLYLPKKVKLPAPAVLYVCGHARTIVDGVSYGNHVNYQHHPAWFAANGYVCLIIDTLQLGEIQGLHHGTHNLKMWWWQTLGYTPAGIECWNGIRALDYLQSRKEVDGKRIGVTGRSGGGATSWWIAAADDRPQCIIPVAGIADLKAHIVEADTKRFRKGVISGHCDCMYFINSYRWDFPMVAALCAPRPVLLGNSDMDAIFPVAGYRRLAEKVRPIYKLYGAADKFALLETSGPHKDTPELRRGAFRWMNRWLKGDPGDPQEIEYERFTPKQLQVFARRPEDALNATIHETFIKPNRPELPRTSKAIQAWWPLQSKKWMAALEDKVFSGWPAEPTGLNAKQTEVVHDGLRVRAIDFTSQEAVELRMWLITAATTNKPRLTIMSVVDEQGWSEWQQILGPKFADLLQSDPKPKLEDKFRKKLQALSAFKWAYAVVAPRGIGPTRWSGVGTPTDTHIRRRFALIGQTLDGQRVWDVRRALEAVRAQTKGIPIWLRGKREMAGIALYASLFAPEVARLDLWNLPSTHSRGPIFLNVRRHLDVPQAVALAFPREIFLYVNKSDRAWDWPIRLQKGLSRSYLKVREIEQ